MPILNNETLDDPLIHDETVAFNGGVYSAERKNRLGENMFSLGINTVIGENGQLVTRWGSNKLGTDAAGASRVLGMAYMDTPSLEWLVRVIQNGGAAKVQKHDGVAANAWVDVAGFTPDVNARMEVVPALNKLYFLNGVDTPRNWDGTTWVTHGTTGNDMPLGSIAEWCQYRMFVAGVLAKPDTVFFCDLLDPSDTHWNHTAKSFQVTTGEGDPITSVKRWVSTYLAVLKGSSLWVANVDSSLTLGAQIPLKCVHDSIGCLAHRTVCRVGNDLFFLSDDGVRSMRQSIADGESNEITDPLSLPVGDIFRRLNKNAADTACAAFYNKRYIIAIPLDNATQPNVVLSYNTEFKVWEGYWLGLTPTVFVRSIFASVKRFNWGQADGRTLQWRNWVLPANETGTDFQDDGAEIPSTFGLRSHNFKEPKNDKKGVVLELEFDESRATAVTVTAFRDEASGGTVLATITSGLSSGITFPLTFPLVFPAQGIKRVPVSLDDLDPFRELAVQLSAPSGKLALRCARFAAFLETMPIGQ